VGFDVGLEVGLVGLDVGLEVGFVGLDVGLNVGLGVGAVGRMGVGLKVGLDVGLEVGLGVGLEVGLGVPDRQTRVELGVGKQLLEFSTYSTATKSHELVGALKTADPQNMSSNVVTLVVFHALRVWLNDTA